RFRHEKRMTLPRKTGSVKTPWGPVQAKRVETPAGSVLYPEYEDCRRLALENQVPLKDVYAAVNRCSPEEFIESEE
ncbi:MAG: LarC family nickel insertion protein, partial [Desulfobulbaceae bacterium]|nr:LarC family nickel insertion protein [Desulfobulbaceae bacterium]